MHQEVGDKHKVTCKKKFRPSNPIRFFARPVLTALFLTNMGASAWLMYYFAFLQLSLGHFLLALVYAVATWWVALRIYRELWSVLWATITVSETEIIWRCPLCPTHVIQVDDCIIGMENETSGWNMTYPHIYFSKQPYPREFSNKIQKIPNSDNFIKFRYRAELADYLVEHLPKKKILQVAYYQECEKRTLEKRRRRKRK